MKKKLVSAVLSTAVVCSLSISVFFAQESGSVNVNPSRVGQEGIITPLKVDKEWGSKINDERSTSTRSFTMNPGYGHLKLYMVNYSSHSVNVTLEHTDKVYFSKTIEGGGNLDWRSWEEGYPDGMRAGNYILTWSGGQHDAYGEYWGKAASQTSDF
ncbi:hypothetical protein [Paenibacillus ginsengihumi]|uniref:hypothetical protein n=1 Tax=Paenibacillus ginsengihumi TaxID=431596 RepID=UPI0012EBB60C|nr:hypothetical protein [Paenibacillus ginsengihumi]